MNISISDQGNVKMFDFSYWLHISELPGLEPMDADEKPLAQSSNVIHQVASSHQQSWNSPLLWLLPSRRHLTAYLNMDPKILPGKPLRGQPAIVKDKNNYQ